MFDQLKLFSLSIVLILATGCAQASETVSQSNPISQTQASATTVAILQTKPREQSKPGVLPADQMLAEAINYFNKNDYQVTINIADSLHLEYPGSPEDIEAQTLKEEAEIKKSELRASSTNFLDSQEYKDDQAAFNMLDGISWRLESELLLSPEEIENLQKIIKVYPNTPTAEKVRNYLTKYPSLKAEQLQREETWEIEELFNDGQKEFANGDASKLKELIQKYPESAEANLAREMLAKASAELEDIKETIRSSIRITKLRKTKPNSAGGVDVYIGFKNLSKKTIKYANFTVTAYNAVGDPVKCEIRDKATFFLEATGPFETGEGFSGSGKYWEAVWYAWSISKVKLDRISIEYMDGTEVSFSEGLDAAFE